MTVERLQKVMAKAGVASRRQSETLILRGLVRVDGKVVREMGVKVDPEINTIEVMGQAVSTDTPRSYVMLNKPRGFITTVSDPFGRPTVMKLLPHDSPNLFPVGRLDLNSEGLLLLTNDGELAFRLTHPKYKVPKTYVVTVRGVPNTGTVWKLRQGVVIEGKKTAPALVRIKKRGGGKTVLEITITEGMKRQVREMCRAVGHPVVALRRVRIGPVDIGNLESGQSKPLARKDLAALRQAVGLD